MSPPRTRLPHPNHPALPKAAPRAKVVTRAPKPRKPPAPPPLSQRLDSPLPRDQSLLDVVDNLLNKGVVISGDAVLGVADVDLVYLKLSALLCAADKLSR